MFLPRLGVTLALEQVGRRKSCLTMTQAPVNLCFDILGSSMQSATPIRATSSCYPRIPVQAHMVPVDSDNQQNNGAVRHVVMRFRRPRCYDPNPVRITTSPYWHPQRGFLRAHGSPSDLKASTGIPRLSLYQRMARNPAPTRSAQTTRISCLPPLSKTVDGWTPGLAACPVI